jgi:hypothetical protein
MAFLSSPFVGHTFTSCGAQTISDFLSVGPVPRRYPGLELVLAAACGVNKRESAARSCTVHQLLG